MMSSRIFCFLESEGNIDASTNVLPSLFISGVHNMLNSSLHNPILRPCKESFIE